MTLCKLERRNDGRKSPVSIKYQNLHTYKGLILLCQSILETRRIAHLHGSAHFTIPLSDYLVILKSLEYNLKILKQDLKATSKKLSYQSKLNKWKSINKKFSINPKNAYHKLWGGNIEIKQIPIGKEFETFWKDIWGKKSNFNPGTPSF